MIPILDRKLGKIWGKMKIDSWNALHLKWKVHKIGFSMRRQAVATMWFTEPNKLRVRVMLHLKRSLSLLHKSQSNGCMIALSALLVSSFESSVRMRLVDEQL